MKQGSTHFCYRRGSAGLSLRLFVLVALAATTASTRVFADKGEVGRKKSSEELRWRLQFVELL